MSLSSLDPKKLNSEGLTDGALLKELRTNETFTPEGTFMIRGRAVLKTCKVRRNETNCCRNKLFHLPKFLLTHTSTCILETLMQQNSTSIWKSLMHIHYYARRWKKNNQEFNLPKTWLHTKFSLPCQIFFPPFQNFSIFRLERKTVKMTCNLPFSTYFLGFLFSSWKI